MAGADQRLPAARLSAFVLPRVPGRASGALDHRQNVALAVLEPGGPGAALVHDAIGVLAGHAVVLEHDAARLQIGDLALDVRDLPEGLAGLRSAGVRRRVQEAAGA